MKLRNHGAQIDIALAGHEIIQSKRAVQVQAYKAGRHRVHHRPGELLYEKLFATGRQIRLALERMLAEAEIPARVVGVDALFDVYFTETDITDYRSTLLANKQMVLRFNELLLESGVFRGDTKFYLSTAHTQDDVDQTIDAFASAIADLR